MLTEMAVQEGKYASRSGSHAGQQDAMRSFWSTHTNVPIWWRATRFSSARPITTDEDDVCGVPRLKCYYGEAMNIIRSVHRSLHLRALHHSPIGSKCLECRPAGEAAGRSAAVRKADDASGGP